MELELHFYWYTELDEKNRQLRGQLNLARRRMEFIRGELASVLDANDIEDMLERLQYHAENYYIRAFELRERTRLLIADLCGDEKLAKLLKGNRRGEALRKIGAILPALVEPTDRLLKTLDADIQLRNMHTHETFLLFGLVIGDTPVDLQDVLPEYEDPLRAKAKLFVEDYIRKCSDLIDATMSLLKAIDNVGSYLGGS